MSVTHTNVCRRCRGTGKQPGDPELNEKSEMTCRWCSGRGRVKRGGGIRKPPKPPPSTFTSADYVARVERRPLPSSDWAMAEELADALRGFHLVGNSGWVRKARADLARFDQMALERGGQEGGDPFCDCGHALSDHENENASLGDNPIYRLVCGRCSCIDYRERGGQPPASPKPWTMKRGYSGKGSVEDLGPPPDGPGLTASSNERTEVVLTWTCETCGWQQDCPVPGYPGTIDGEHWFGERRCGPLVARHAGYRAHPGASLEELAKLRSLAASGEGKTDG